MNASGRARASSRYSAAASSIAASASSRRPRPASRSDWLFSDVARSGVNASGRARASSRYRAAGFLDRGQRLLPPPQIRQLDRLVVQRGGQGGGERVGAGRGQLPVQGRRFLDRGQRLLPPPQIRQAVRLVVQRHGQVGGERIGAGPGQLPADGDGFLDRGQRLLPPPQTRQPGRLVVQRRGQVGGERIGAGPGQLPVQGRRFLDRGQRLLPPPQTRQPGRLVVQRHGQVGGERIGAGPGQLPVQGRRFLDRGQRLLPPPHITEQHPAGIQPQRPPGRSRPVGLRDPPADTGMRLGQRQARVRDRVSNRDHHLTGLRQASDHLREPEQRRFQQRPGGLLVRRRAGQQDQRPPGLPRIQPRQARLRQRGRGRKLAGHMQLRQPVRAQRAQLPVPVRRVQVPQPRRHRPGHRHARDPRGQLRRRRHAQQAPGRHHLRQLIHAQAAGPAQQPHRVRPAAPVMLLMPQQLRQHHRRIHPQPGTGRLLPRGKDRDQRRRMQIQYPQLTGARHAHPSRVRRHHVQPGREKRHRPPHHLIPRNPRADVPGQRQRRQAGIAHHVPHHPAPAAQPLPPLTRLPGQQQHPDPPLIPGRRHQQPLQPGTRLRIIHDQQQPPARSSGPLQPHHLRFPALLHLHAPPAPPGHPLGKFQRQPGLARPAAARHQPHPARPLIQAPPLQRLNLRLPAGERHHAKTGLQQMRRTIHPRQHLRAARGFHRLLTPRRPLNPQRHQPPGRHPDPRAQPAPDPEPRRTQHNRQHRGTDPRPPHPPRPAHHSIVPHPPAQPAPLATIALQNRARPSDHDHPGRPDAESDAPASPPFHSQDPDL